MGRILLESTTDAAGQQPDFCKSTDRPGYFETVGMQLIEGRAFTPRIAKTRSRPRILSGRKRAAR
jgi:hypothetical protein